MGQPSDEQPSIGQASRLRSSLLAVVVGTCAAVAGIALVFTIVALPIFVLASVRSGSGLDQDLVRQGLFFVALPSGLLAGVIVGALVGRWFTRGGRLPTDRTPIDS